MRIFLNLMLFAACMAIIWLLLARAWDMGYQTGKSECSDDTAFHQRI